MRYIAILLLGISVTFCKRETTKDAIHFSKVDMEFISKDSMSIRAIDIYNDTLLGFGFHQGYGFVNLITKRKELIHFEEMDTILIPKNWVSEQRSVGFTTHSFFTLGIGSPARLRKVNLENRKEKIVYTEVHKNVFYDAMAFWNDKEGIAIGDPTESCLSIIITRDGGETWTKIPCSTLPQTVEGEGAFAASNGNIAIVGNHTWVISGGMKSRVFYSPDKGKTWSVYDTPMIQGESTTGGYSIHFYDKDNGIIFGGDYSKPDMNSRNKAITTDGGKQWKIVAENRAPGYKSCVRYLPNSTGKSIVAVGFTGISISNDFGKHWKEISKEGFYILRFINDSTAIAAGKYKIAKLTFRP